MPATIWRSETDDLAEEGQVVDVSNVYEGRGINAAPCLAVGHSVCADEEGVMAARSESLTDVRQLFLASAEVVAGSLADAEVGRMWAQPSVLDGQRIGGLAGHLARGGVWVVDDYLDADGAREAPLVESAVEYFAQIAASLTETEHRQVRERGAEVGAVGQEALVAALRERLRGLADRLAHEPAARTVSVAQGALTMRLDDYLETRIVEQVVHLDDLARSVGRTGWDVPVAAQQLAIRIGCGIAVERHGADAMIHCLYRSRLDPVLPVL